MLTVDELNTLLVLNGNKRIPHLEVEIFEDIELYVPYIIKLATAINMKLNSDNITCLLARYAFITNCRWPVAELLISKDPYAAFYYSLYVIKGRWKEAEWCILNSAHANSYMSWVTTL